MARVFKGEGATVVGVDLNESETVDINIRADVTDEQQVAGMYGRTKQEFGRVDVIVNNAGINPPEDKSVLDTPVETWQWVQDVNVRSVFLCCKHGIPHLLEARRRLGHQHRLVRGGDGCRDVADLVHRVKGAVLSMSREMGVQFARQGVRVNALCPGPVDTPLLQELFASDPAKAARRLVHVPTGRFGQAREIANAALFLASDESSYVNATTFLVDGGLSGAYVTPE